MDKKKGIILLIVLLVAVVYYKSYFKVENFQSGSIRAPVKYPEFRGDKTYKLKQNSNNNYCIINNTILNCNETEFSNASAITFIPVREIKISPNIAHDAVTPPVVGLVKTTMKGILFFFNSCTAKAVLDICISAIELSIIR